MEKLDKQKLETVFIDVRKAYRLLYFYQRRVMDTANLCAQQLERNIQYGYSLYSANAPKNGSRLNLNRWAWDWLNMYSYEFHLGEEVVDENVYNSAIAVHADSGLDDSPQGVTPIDVERFANVDQCITKIYFYVGKNIWKPAEFEHEWSKTSNDEYIYTEGENKIFASKRFDLSEMIDEDSIMNSVAMFKEYCLKNAISIFS